MTPDDPALAAADGQLAEAATRLDYLLAVTPVDTEAAWRSFQAAGGDAAPTFTYRDLPAELDALRRDIVAAPVSQITDPRVAELLRRLQHELVGVCDLLAARCTPRFPEISAELHGEVDEAEADAAAGVLDAVRSWHEHDWSSAALDAAAFATAARAELEALESEAGPLDAGVELREDVHGVMVVRRTLLVDTRYRLDPRRTDALVQHEVGTHIVTEVNGHRQPIRVLESGLAGFEQTQEGLAVLAEHLVGGLTAERLALLAARVLAVRDLIVGRSFADSVADLHGTHGFSPRAAFDIVARVHRGGGLLKDAIYLRGLAQVLAHLRRGGRLDALLAGKVALPDISIVSELIDEGVLSPPRVIPRWAGALDDRSTLPADVLDLARHLLSAEDGSSVAAHA
jgi:uncharacterized protein (TIGR02421 family)